MHWPSNRTAITLVVGAGVIAIALFLVDLFAVSILLGLCLPVLVLVLTRMRSPMHWVLFAVIIASTIVALIDIERNDSSTAGFGVVVVPTLLTVGVLIFATVDRYLAERCSSPPVG